MAKRPNPYTDDYIQQSKTHVGLKQLNNTNDGLRKVYEKTLELLFRGAKKTLCDAQNCETIYVERKDGMKQLFISKDGSLLHSGNMAINKNFEQQFCLCSGLKVDYCAYCELPLCVSCQQVCGVCTQSYCTKCSLIGQEGSPICFSCYS